MGSLCSIVTVLGPAGELCCEDMQIYTTHFSHYPPHAKLLCRASRLKPYLDTRYTRRSMLSIPHMMTGAFIASQIPNPLIYIPATFAAHYLQDWIPHWDVGTGLSNGTRKRSTAFLLELVDLAISFTAIYAVWQVGRDGLATHVWIGGVAGIAPDLFEAPRNFLRWEPFFLKPLNELHGKFHHSTPNKVLGLIPQFITIAVIVALVRMGM